MSWTQSGACELLVVNPGLCARGHCDYECTDISSAQTLPPHTLLSLIYRVAVMHLAARIIPVIRKSSLGWSDTPGEDDSAASGSTPFWDGRSLGEEPAVRPQCLSLRGRS